MTIKASENVRGEVKHGLGRSIPVKVVGEMKS